MWRAGLKMTKPYRLIDLTCFLPWLILNRSVVKLLVFFGNLMMVSKFWNCVIRQLRRQGLSANHVDTALRALAISRIYALPHWDVFICWLQTGKVNGFFKRTYDTTKRLVTVGELFNSSAHQLFCCSLAPLHCCPTASCHHHRDGVITLVALEGTTMFCHNLVINRSKYLTLTGTCLTMFNYVYCSDEWRPLSSWSGGNQLCNVLW